MRDLRMATERNDGHSNNHVLSQAPNKRSIGAGAVGAATGIRRASGKCVIVDWRPLIAASRGSGV
jgi:hypothetical protein